jgi:hypothetical protein
MLDFGPNKIILITLQACDEHVGKGVALVIIIFLLYSWAP